MKIYIKASEIQPTLTSIQVLCDGGNSRDEVKANSFYMEALTSDGDTVWVGAPIEEDVYSIETAGYGRCYADKSISRTLDELFNMYQASSDMKDTIFTFAKKYSDDNITAADDIHLDKWVIVDKETKDNTENQLFIGPQKSGKFYYPSFTSTGRRNYDRAKLFNSAEDARAYIEKQNKEKKLFIRLDYTAGRNGSPNFTERDRNIEILPYAEAMNAIGDPEKNYKNYKQKQADDRKKSSEAYRERYKKEHANDSTKNPGKYKVRFWYANSWLGAETFTVDAESINDAFKKAKDKALRQDPYRDSSGYDERMIFNKNEIRKID